MLNAGDFPTGATVYLILNTFDSNDPSASVTITNLASTDIHIHKDGGTTQRSSANGITVSIDFDGITGNHLVSIDLSDNTDAGFYAAGSEYQVRMEGTTIDGATINAWIGMFSIARSGGVATILTDTEASQTAEAAILSDTEASQTAEAAVLADTEAAVADTNELQTDWADGGRLDLILDAALADTEASQTAEAAILADAEAILTDTGTTLPASLATLLTDTEASQVAEAAILADSEAVLTDTGTTLPATLATLLTDTEASQTAEAAILVDTEAISADAEAILADTELWDSGQSEPTGVPAAAASPLTKIGVLYMMARNKVTVTSSKKTVFGDDDAAEFEKDLSDDGTTYTESEANAI